jgi:hypothetical protein
MISRYKKNCLVFVFLLQTVCLVNAQQISGNIFADRDGLTDNNITSSAGVNNPKTNIGGTLFANLLNNLHQAVASTPIGTDGTYTFSNVIAGNYVVQLTINPSAGTYINPINAIANALPTGWTNTGEFVGNTLGNDGTVNGESSIINVLQNNLVTDVNFGIERLPETANVFAYIGTGGSDGVFMPNVLFSLGNAAFTGSDIEDQPLAGPLAGKTIKIINATYNVPNTTEVGTLFYDGVILVASQIISVYNPSLLKGKITYSGNPYYITGQEVKFYYSYIDAAGIPDPTAAVYTVRYPVTAILNINLQEFLVQKNNCNAIVNWKTSSETNSDKFEIEYSKDVAGNFELLKTVTAAGNSNSLKNYEFTYAMESGVAYFFRLKMINSDGTFKYSDIQKLSCSNTKNEIIISPNPVVDRFQIKGMAKGKNTILIYGKSGNLVNSLSVTNNTNINISHLPSGVYVVKIFNENGTRLVETLIKY